MTFKKAYIPFGAYWVSPFAKWQGSFANLHPIRFAGEVAKQAMEERKISSQGFTSIFLGMTIPSKHALYSAPWLAGMLGAEDLTGPMIAQACATSARVIGSAAAEVEASNGNPASILCVTADRTSNGPQVIYPNPLAPGGRVDSEHWVLDNFDFDPYAHNSMIETAERVASEYAITTQQQHEVVLLRYEQYQQSIAHDYEFQKRYMVSPVEVNPTGRKVMATVATDEGVFPTTAEALARLKPVLPDGTVTFGGQTYPADGTAGMIITSREEAKELSRDPNIDIRILAFAEGRAEKGYMPKANTPAIERVLERAGLKLSDIKAIKTHNPFAVNDIYLSKEFDIPLDGMNNFGSSLIWGHPQGPTGMRLIIELIEELVHLGGGYGLFTGCAAGDTAAAVIVEIRTH